MTKRILFIITCVVLVSAGPAFSQCADPNNLLSTDSCGFDTAASVGDGTGWWNMVPEIAGDPLWGTVVHSDTGGRTSPGSMEGTPFDNGAPPIGWGKLMGVRYCLPTPVAVDDVLGFGAWINVTSGSVGFCSAVLFTSSSTDCSTGSLDQTNVDNFSVPAATWTKINNNDTTLTATTAAVAVELRMSCWANMNNDDFLVTFDDAYVGPDMVPVELQSFSIE